jgi:hypothetical protein
MTRALLPYFNESSYGSGPEGVANYANSVLNNLLLPAFLIVVYILAIYGWSKSDKKMGGGLFFISLLFFIIAIIAQTFTLFMQLIIFIFFIGMIVGIILHFVED